MPCRWTALDDLANADWGRPLRFVHTAANATPPPPTVTLADGAGRRRDLAPRMAPIPPQMQVDVPTEAFGSAPYVLEIRDPDGSACVEPITLRAPDQPGVSQGSLLVLVPGAKATPAAPGGEILAITDARAGHFHAVFRFDGAPAVSTHASDLLRMGASLRVDADTPPADLPDQYRTLLQSHGLSSLSEAIAAAGGPSEAAVGQLRLVTLTVRAKLPEPVERDGDLRRFTLVMHDHAGDRHRDSAGPLAEQALWVASVPRVRVDPGDLSALASNLLRRARLESPSGPNPVQVPGGGGVPLRVAELPTAIPIGATSALAPPAGAGLAQVSQVLSAGGVVADVPVSWEVEWIAKDNGGKRVHIQRPGGGAPAPVGDATVVLMPPFAEPLQDGTTSHAAIDRDVSVVVRASLNLYAAEAALNKALTRLPGPAAMHADLIESGPATYKLVEQTLGPVRVRVQPLDAPRMVFFFDREIGPGRDPGAWLALAPRSNVTRDAELMVSKLLGSTRSLGDLHGFAEVLAWSAGLSGASGVIDRGRIAERGGMKAVNKTNHHDRAKDFDSEPKDHWVLYKPPPGLSGYLKDDIELDDEAEALIFFGPPGARFSMYSGRNFTDERVDITIGTMPFVILPNFHFLDPTGQSQQAARQTIEALIGSSARALPEQVRDELGLTRYPPTTVSYTWKPGRRTFASSPSSAEFH